MRTLYTEATNIRSVGSSRTRFTPAEAGVTAVTGPNGAGKTTMTTLIPLLSAWGDAKTVAGSMADVLAEGAKSGKATWCFTAGDKTYTVTRTITRTKSGASSKVSVAIDGSTEMTKGMRATEAAQMLTDILGVGPDEFLATSLIAQGEIDNLTSATPAVVRDQVRKTLGLDRAVRAADRLEREVKPARDALPEAPDPATVKRAQAAAIDAAGAEADAREKSEQAAAAYANIRDDGAGLDQELMAAEDAYGDWKGASGALTEAQRAVEGASEREASARAEAERHLPGSGFTTLPASEEARGAYQQGLDFFQQVQALRKREPQVADVGYLAQQKEQSDTRLSAAQQAMQDVGSPDEDKAAASSASARAATLVESADRLDGHGDCPTCGTHLSDSAGLVSSLREQASQLRDEAIRATQRAQSISGEAHAADQELRSAENAAQQAERALSEASAAAEQHAAWESELAALMGTATDEGISAQLSAINGLATSVAMLENAEHGVEQAKERLSSLQETASSDGEALKATLDEVTSRAEKYGAAESEAAKTASAAQATADAAVAEWRRLTSTVDQLESAVAARKDAERKIGSKLVAAKALREFATAYTTEKVSAIEDSVNSLLAGVSTPFTRFRLGADFSPAVQVAGGTWRPTHELSGGESAMVGLMLRIGVVAAITSGVLDVTLTADEPLANLDEQARAQVARLLSDLPCPVTVISHAPEPVETAAKVVEVSRGTGGYTTVS